MWISKATKTVPTFYLNIGSKWKLFSMNKCSRGKKGAEHSSMHCPFSTE